MVDISKIRKEYQKKSLDEGDASLDPFDQFHRWFTEALEADVAEPTAMTLSTATKDGKPSGRLVLLKGYEQRRFVFYTNYGGRKARELEENPLATLTFFWKEVERQIRIEGSVTRASSEESDVYFASRPRGSQIGAWASKQSEAVVNKTVAYGKVALVAARFHVGRIPRPEFWGGYVLTPDCYEFWQGRPNRFHDRLRYQSMPDGTWLRERLWP